MLLLGLKFFSAVWVLRLYFTIAFSLQMIKSPLRNSSRPKIAPNPFITSTTKTWEILKLNKNTTGKCLQKLIISSKLCTF